jgi:hypothetical protein
MSKVKVTGTLNVRIVSAHYLENYLSLSHYISHIDWSKLVDDPIDFGVFRSMVKVTVTLSMFDNPSFDHIVSADYLKNYLSKSLHISLIGHNY